MFERWHPNRNWNDSGKGATACSVREHWRKLVGGTVNGMVERRGVRKDRKSEGASLIEPPLTVFKMSRYQDWFGMPFVLLREAFKIGFDIIETI